MTFKKEEGKKVLSIIEGQQRITCSIILICVIRDILKENGNAEVSDRIDEHII